MQSLVLAGGKGIRLRPVTLHTPKPIVPIANTPLLFYQLELLRRGGVRDVVLSLSYQPHKIEDRIGDGSHVNIRVSYAVETSPLGTAGAFKNGAHLINETAVVLNGDILTDVDLEDVIRFHKDAGAAATIVLSPVPNPTGYGLVVTDAEHRVLRFIEKPKPEEITCDTINAGIYILEPKLLDYIPEGEPFTFEYGLFPKLVEMGEIVMGFVSHGYWRDIGTPESYLQANLDVIAGRVKLLEPPVFVSGDKFDSDIHIDSTSLIDPSCTVKPGVHIVNSVISRNCYIEERAHIENSLIRSASRIGTGASVSGALIGKGCHVGKAVNIGAGSVLGDKSVVTDYGRI